MPYFPTVSQGSSSSCVVNFGVRFQNVEFDASYVCHPLRAYTASVSQLFKDVSVLCATID